MRTASFAFVAALALGCARPSRDPLVMMPSATATRPTDGAARAAIMAASREFSAQYERGDVAAMVAIYATDGVALPPGRHAIRGTAALTEYWTRAPGVRVLEHRATPDSIVVIGPVAYDWGTYRVRTQADTSAARETVGKYVIVWREAAPGSWRMHVDMWNAAPAPAR
jgi:ketosteroid isomerase-like protein